VRALALSHDRSKGAWNLIAPKRFKSRSDGSGRSVDVKSPICLNDALATCIAFSSSAGQVKRAPQKRQASVSGLYSA
jgi:hypothetical protein